VSPILPVMLPCWRYDCKILFESAFFDICKDAL